MWAKASSRIILLTRSHQLQQSKRWCRILTRGRAFSSAPRGGGRQPEAAGGAGGWRYSGSSRRSARTFLQVVPLPWLAVACFSAVDVASNAYVVETEDFARLMQRCNFHLAAAAAGDAADMSALYDLLEWVYESIDAAGPTALPKLLDADVVGVALRGAQSPNVDMSTVCYEILNVLSSNEHVAARMAKDPSLRAALVGEVRRQIVSWKSSDSGDEQYAPEQIHDGAPGEGDFQGSTPPARQVRQIRRLTGGMGVEGRNRLDTETDPVGSAAEGSDGNGNPKHNVAGASSELVAGDIDVTEANAAAGTIILDPFYAALTLRTLSNVMRASRIGAGQPSAAASQSGSSVSLKLPWPARVLYGGNDYDKVQSDGAAEEAAEWPVERKLVEDLAELMLSVSARGPEGVRVVSAEGDGVLDEVARAEAKKALQGLESAAASVLRETSSQPHLVGLLMRRRPLVALVTVSWKGHSVKAEDWAAEAALNVFAAYRSLHGISAPLDHTMRAQEVVSTLTSWSSRILAEEEAGIVASDLGAGMDDQDFVRQAQRAIPPLALSDPLLTITASAVVGVASVAWGAIRRWVAWRRAGETFAAVSRFALPRALLWAGLRAGLGATALTATHGPFGFRSQMRYRTLDATSGSRGTLAMSGAREVADLGYLYVILRLCPYSLLPAFVLNAMLRGGSVGADAWST